MNTPYGLINYNVQFACFPGSEQTEYQSYKVICRWAMANRLRSPGPPNVVLLIVDGVSETVREDLGINKQQFLKSKPHFEITEV